MADACLADEHALAATAAQAVAAERAIEAVRSAAQAAREVEAAAAARAQGELQAALEKVRGGRDMRARLVRCPGHPSAC